MSAVQAGPATSVGTPAIKREVADCCRAIEAGESFALRLLRPYTAVAGTEWFANSRLDEASKTDASARPRP